MAATIERCQGCFGAEVAGPIATQVMESLLKCAPPIAPDSRLRCS